MQRISKCLEKNSQFTIKKRYPFSAAKMKKKKKVFLKHLYFKHLSSFYTTNNMYTQALPSLFPFSINTINFPIILKMYQMSRLHYIVIIHNSPREIQFLKEKILIFVRFESDTII